MPSTPTGPHALTEFGTPFAVRNLTGNGTHLYFARSRQAHRPAARRMAGERRTGLERPVAALAAGERCRSGHRFTGLDDFHASAEFVS
jgi:hypothetical protein